MLKNFGGGMGGMGGMLKQAKAMQDKMTAFQEELAAKTFEGSAGGGMVRVIMSGKGEMKKVVIDPSVVVPDEKDMLEDLVLAACNDARNKIDEYSESNMSRITGGLKLPF